jgi:glycosyltransferase involved in cell wall biosynthesis
MSSFPTKHVHIRLSDTGWILERLAKEIAVRLPYVSYDTFANGSAQIQYYMTYGCREQRVSPIEIALFTHKEAVPAAAAKFEHVAREVDFCVAQSLNTERILREGAVSNVSTISPGVDIERFTPVVRVGVVGRTYHTGRKGEALVAQVMDIPGIEWHFTGPGWPGPARHVPDEELPAFYRSLDYVLVPALIEGGPMCVLEALACGCKVIASPVGWVPQFPHIEFKLGDAVDLRRVLTQVVAEKQALHRSVEAYTWDNWARQHHELFERLLRRKLPREDIPIEATPTEAMSASAGAMKAAVVVHGGEMSGSLGGPSVRAPRTVATLKRIGVDAQFHAGRNFDTSSYDVIHAFNIWPPAECEVLLRQIEKHGRPSVLSPIFLDLSERKFYHQHVPEILKAERDDIAQIDEELEKLRGELTRHRHASEAEREPLPGYFSTVRRLVNYADHLILLSEHERSELHRIGVDHPSTSIVRNPVEAEIFANGDPSLFANRFGVQDYVLCVGRIESRKNQAMLAYALRDTGLPLVFIGHEGDSKYAELVRRWAGDRAHFTGRIEPNSPMLASALAGCRVFCLPSWSEGAPLVALEAAAAGCNMVLSNRSSEEEYFGELARYVDPADPADIRQKVLEAFEEGWVVDRAHRLQQLVREHHSWSTYALLTQDAYSRTLASRSPPVSLTPAPEGRAPRIYIDLTTSAHHDGPPTGIARVEDRLAFEMRHLTGIGDVRYVLWNSTYRRFIEVSPTEVATREIKLLRGESAAARFQFPDDLTPTAEMSFREDDHFVVFGGAWIRNTAYLEDLWALKCLHRISLVATVYDVIQHKFQYLFPQGVGGEFAQNCRRLIDICDRVLTCSRQSAADISTFCVDSGIPTPPIHTFRLGDDPVGSDAEEVIQFDRLGDLAEARFVLYVSSIDVRKNHRLLFEAWRRLIKQHGDRVPALVLVGRVGWRGEEAVDMLRADASLAKSIRMLHDINDKTLGWLYDHCLFTVYPSLYEGWGLPVAESLRHRKACLASNAGSLPEVGPGLVDYLDPYDLPAWCQAIAAYSFDPQLLEQKNQRAGQYVPTPWSQPASEVAASVIKATPTVRLTPVLADVLIDFRQNVLPQSQAGSAYKLGGWGRSERNGCWTLGTRAALGFQIAAAPDLPVTLQFECGAFCPDAQPIEFGLSTNGVPLGNWYAYENNAVYSVLIPQEILSQGDLRLVFNVVNPRAPAACMDSNDTRLLGIKIVAMRFGTTASSEVLTTSLLPIEPVIAAPAAAPPPPAEAAPQPVPHSGIKHVDDLVRMNGTSFIEAAYRAVLGRAPDSEGLLHYEDRLAKGISKAAVIADLALSAEGRGRTAGLPGIQPIINRYRKVRRPLAGLVLRALLAHSRRWQARSNAIPSDEVTPAMVDSILCEDGVRFVEKAYNVILGRNPDPVGLRHYMASLFAGTSKLRILADIGASEEARARGNLPIDLDLALVEHRVQNWNPFYRRRKQESSARQFADLYIVICRTLRDENSSTRP